MEQIAIVTGANTGIGKATARGLSARDYHVVMACRSVQRGETARREIVEATGKENLTVLPLNLASFGSIRRFAAMFGERWSRLDVLVNNAGLSVHERQVTEDGLELVTGVNHFGHFLLTNLLLAPLKFSAPARVVTVASSRHKAGSLSMEDPQLEHGWDKSQAYANSKLMNVLFTYELARRAEASGVTANCFNPGLVRSDFFRAYNRIPLALRFFLRVLGKEPATAARTALHLACSPELDGVTEKYYDGDKPADSSPDSYNKELARALWEYSERVTGVLD